MAMLGKVRKLYYRDGLPINEIRRRTSLSRNTIKKWLRAPSGATPEYRRREVPRSSHRSAAEIHVRASPAALAVMRRAAANAFLSARAQHRVLRVARSIADLAAQEDVAEEHVAEALRYRGIAPA